MAAWQDTTSRQLRWVSTKHWTRAICATGSGPSSTWRESLWRAGCRSCSPLVATLLDRFVFGPAAVEPEVSTGRDYASRLRYEAQDLAQDLRRQARLNKGGSDLRIKQTDHALDEIETLTTDLDSLLAQIDSLGAP